MCGDCGAKQYQCTIELVMAVSSISGLPFPGVDGINHVDSPVYQSTLFRVRPPSLIAKAVVLNFLRDAPQRGSICETDFADAVCSQKHGSSFSRVECVVRCSKPPDDPRLAELENESGSLRHWGYRIEFERSEVYRSIARVRTRRQAAKDEPDVQENNGKQLMNSTKAAIGVSVICAVFFFVCLFYCIYRNRQAKIEDLMIKASHPSLATFSDRSSRYEDALSISSVSNGKIGYPPQYIESYESHISSARAIERNLLQRGLMGLVGSPVHNGQAEEVDRPESGATIEDVEDDFEPELEALVDEASIGEEATIPALSALGPEMTDDDNPLIIPNGYPQTAESPPFITEEGEEMLKYTIYDQQPDGIRNVIGTLTTVRGIPLRELRPALSQLAKDDSFRFHNDRTSLDVKNENLAIDRIFKNKALVIRFPNRASSHPEVPVPEARNSAELAQSNQRLQNPMEEDLERGLSDELDDPDPPERIENAEAVKPQQDHEKERVIHTDEPAFPDDEDEVPEVNSPPIAKTSSSGNSSTHSAERGPSSTRSGGSYVGPLGLCHRPECNNAARVKCVSCGQVAYCSSKCLRLDAPRHRTGCYRDAPWAAPQRNRLIDH